MSMIRTQNRVQTADLGHGSVLDRGRHEKGQIDLVL